MIISLRLWFLDVLGEQIVRTAERPRDLVVVNFLVELEGYIAINKRTHKNKFH